MLSAWCIYDVRQLVFARIDSGDLTNFGAMLDRTS